MKDAIINGYPGKKNILFYAQNANQLIGIKEGGKIKMANGTQTSSFGTSARINHDSSKFYNSRMYKELDAVKSQAVQKENLIPKDGMNKIYCSSSENMKGIPDNSVHLMITSPPYNVGKDYDKDMNLQEYLSMLRNVLEETKRVLVDGGRVCINIANLGRKPYLPLHSYIIQIMSELGFLMRGEIIWDKSSSAGTSTAWGSWKSAKNPILRDVHEYILIFSKESYSRNTPNNAKKKDSIKKEEFMEFTKSIWNFSATSAKKIGHPAPFPEELPRRLIELYSFQEDIVLDPFMGSGQTAIEAIKCRRNYIGYDVNRDYCKLAEERIKKVNSQTKLA